MKISKYYVFVIITFIAVSVFGQNSYAEGWFVSHCEYCKVNAQDQHKIVLGDENAWHNAHVSFLNRNFRTSKKYILEDNNTNDTLKQLFQNHLLLKLEVKDQAKNYFLNIQNTQNNDIKQFVYKNLGNSYFKEQTI